MMNKFPITMLALGVDCIIYIISYPWEITRLVMLVPSEKTNTFQVRDTCAGADHCRAQHRVRLPF